MFDTCLMDGKTAMERQQILPRFNGPQSPDVVPLLEIHRNHDGHVAFCRKDEQGTHHDLFSVPARDLEIVWPELEDVLERDSYFSINGFYRGGFGYAQNSPASINPPLMRANHKAKDLRWLTACFVDIDCHNLGIDTGTAVGAIINAQDRGLPAASMITRSGRGVWAFWFLTETDKHGQQTPVNAWQEKINLWYIVQRDILRRFADIGSDANSNTSNRITRVPGSVNTKALTAGTAARRVDYWLQANPDGKRFSYSISELASELGLEVPKCHPKVESKSAELSERGRKGQRGRWLKARRQFEQLWNMRGTWPEGTRNGAVFVYATILVAQRLDEQVIWDELHRLLNDLEPGNHPFTMADFLAAGQTPLEAANAARNAPSKAGLRFARIKNQTIADQLDITPEESAVLETWPPASRFGERVQADETIGRTERREKRRHVLKQIVSQADKIPTLRELTERLEELGIEAVEATVGTDLKSLGIENPRGKKAKRRKRARNPQRKLL
jgi:hypothetical protein